MLDQDGLIDALKSGQAGANICDHWCRAGAAVENDTYSLFHNHVGSAKTDSQVVHSSEVLGWTATKLGERITVWITGLHRRERVDLNTAG
jgi:hypothetical protein